MLFICSLKTTGNTELIIHEVDCNEFKYLLNNNVVVVERNESTQIAPKEINMYRSLKLVTLQNFFMENPTYFYLLQKISESLAPFICAY